MCYFFSWWKSQKNVNFSKFNIVSYVHSLHDGIFDKWQGFSLRSIHFSEKFCKNLCTLGIRYISKWMFIIGGPPSLDEKGSYEITTVSGSMSRSVTPVSLKTDRGIFLKVFMKLGCLKVKNWQSWNFWIKCHFGDNPPQENPQNRIFWILQGNLVHRCVDLLVLSNGP